MSKLGSGSHCAHHHIRFIYFFSHEYIPTSALYESSFNINNAPKTLQEALDRHDIERCKAKFGFPKDRKTQQSSDSNVATTNAMTATAPSTNGHTNNSTGQIRTSLNNSNKNKSLGTNQEASTVANQYKAPPNQGNRVPLSNLSANANPMNAPQHQGNQVNANFPFTSMSASNSKPIPPGHQQVRQPALSVDQNGYQQPISSGAIHQGVPNTTSNNTASTNRYNSNTVVPQSRNAYSNTYSSVRSIPKEPTPPTTHQQITASNRPIGPPPTATDALKNSNLFSCPSQPTQSIIVVATSNHPNIGTAPPSRRGRFSMDGQHPIQPQQASLVTPTNLYSNSVKRPNDVVNQSNNKRHCRPINPYASS